MTINVRKKSITLMFIGVFTLGSCSKIIEVDVPDNKLVREGAFGSDATAIATVTGLYTTMGGSTGPINGFLGINFWLGLSADELRVLPGQANVDLLNFYRNTLNGNPGNTETTDFWIIAYKLVYRANDLIAGLENNKAISLSIQKQLLGEAKFLRALYYFYLVNLYGDVPLALTTDYSINYALPRTAKQQVYAQIIADLLAAKDNLSENYLGSDLSTITSDKIRPTKWAAIALLSRVYLYAGNYSSSEKEASQIIDGGPFSLETLDNVFLANNNEAIWQIQPTSSANRNTIEGAVFNLPNSGPTTVSFGLNPFFLSTSLINSFEIGDTRRGKWVKNTTGNTVYYYAYKYKLANGTASGSEYSTILRLGEQYLIRAEARIRQGSIDKIAQGIQDLNIIRRRSRAIPTTAIPNPLPDVSPIISESEALKAVLHEKQIELFTEFGQRWLDIKRTGTVDGVMQSLYGEKMNVWNSYQQLFPIPLYDMKNNPSLIGHQNSGY